MLISIRGREGRTFIWGEILSFYLKVCSIHISISIMVEALGFSAHLLNLIYKLTDGYQLRKYLIDKLCFEVNQISV